MPDQPPAPLQFPPRTSPSLEDGLAAQKQEMAMGAIGQLKIIASWADRLRTRPFNRPLYTALHGTPTILIYLSSEAVPDAGMVERVFQERRPWDLRVAAFVSGPYPILRCVLSLPDNPADPYVMESPLDLREGDAQAFCAAGFLEEALDLIVAREDMPDEKHAAVSFTGKGLSSVLGREVPLVVSRIRPGATARDFDAGVTAMEAAFPSTVAGFQDAHRVRLSFAGEARHPLIRASF